MQNPSVITCGLSSESHVRLSQLLGRFLAGCEEQAFDPEQLVELMDSPPEHDPVAVFCGPGLKDPPPLEAAQFLRSQFQSTPIYFIMDDVPDFERRNYLKNGYTDTFSLKIDQKLLERALAESLAASRGAKVYRQARLMDLEPDLPLDFDTAIYLPGNDKYIPFSRAGDAIDQERLERLNRHGYRSISIPLEQMPAYHEYAAARLKALGNTATSPEQQQRLSGCVRELLSGVIVELDREATFSEGRAIMTQASGIVSSYVQSSSSCSCYARILELSEEGADAYCHSMNVSTIAALLALGTGAANPEHLAIAGLLHDVGAPVSGEDLEMRGIETLNRQELEQFMKHVPDTLELIRKRKLLLPGEVTRAIQEHHERFDGTGFPDGKQGGKISVEAQLLAMADDLDRYSAVIPGRVRRSMLDWVKERRLELARGGRAGAFDPALLARVLELFPHEPA